MYRLGVCALTLVTLMIALFATAAAASGAPLDLRYECQPPAPASPDSCAVWHTQPVTLHWLFDSGVLTVVPGSNCVDQRLTADTAGTDITCSVTSLLTGTLTQTATVRVDQTPPTITGAAPQRPPDHNGWYNHPVAFQFSGIDATSGIAGCDAPVFSGPDSASARLTGGCRDAAGNASTSSVPLKYDATPPTITPLPQDSRAGEVNLKWSASPDAVQYSVTREPGDHGPPPTTVYTGTAPEYTDTNVNKNESYTYTVSASDAAANSSSVVMIAIPGGSQMVLGERKTSSGTTFRPPWLRWRRVAHADYYNVQVFRGGRKILSAWPNGTRLQLRPDWRFRGKRFRLTPGRYHWYAWPGFGNRRAHRYGRMICHRSFRIKQLG